MRKDALSSNNIHFEIIVSFGQYLHWSEMQYLHFKTYKEESADSDFIGALAHWLASLYVVSEGWHEIKIPDPIISNLISKYDDYYQVMRRFRNGVYHFQKNPMNEKISAFIHPNSEAVMWAHALIFEFKRFLVQIVPDDEDGKEIKLAIGWWPNEFLISVKAVRAEKYGEINPAMTFLTRV